MNQLRRPPLPVLFILFTLLGSARCSAPAVGPDAALDAIAVDRGAIVDPTVELGTGQSAWEPLADGDSVELIHGPQGGYHLFARIRERVLGPDVQVTFRVTPAEGGAAINDPTDRIRILDGRGLLRTTQGWESSSALLVILVQVRDPAAVVGRRFVLEANVVPTGSLEPSTVRRQITIVDKT